MTDAVVDRPTGTVHPQGHRLLRRRGLQVVWELSFEAETRTARHDRAPDAEPVLGPRRFDTVERCVLDVLRRRVPGDLVDTGVRRGGTVIFMRALLAAYGDRDRAVWVADCSPAPSGPTAPRSAEESGSPPCLPVPLRQVREAFRRYGLLDDQVRFLPGRSEESLPSAPIRRVAVIRLAGDPVDATGVALRALYPKLSPGGYVVLDDHAVAGRRQAVEDFRTEFGVTDDLVPVDWTGQYWQRTR